MSYEHPGASALDYQSYRYGNVRLQFRGPPKPLEGTYVLCFGGVETYGKFISKPYPDLLEQEIGMSAINMGGIGASIDAFLSEPDLIDAANDAAVVVVQIAGAHMLSNRYYSVHPRRNDRFLKPSALLRQLYPSLDFADITFTGHLLTAMQEAAPKAFKTIVDELQDTWTRRMAVLLDKVESPTVLLWMGDMAPLEYGEPPSSISHPGGPLFVDREMVETAASQATRYVEVVASRDALATGTRGMTYGELDTPAAAALPGPRTHEEVAEALAPVILELRGAIS